MKNKNLQSCNSDNRNMTLSLRQLGIYLVKRKNKSECFNNDITFGWEKREEGGKFLENKMYKPGIKE